MEKNCIKGDVKKKDNFKLWLKCAGIRAIKTFCQCCVAMIPVDVMITEIDFKVVLLTSLNALLLSILTSIAGLPEVEEDK